MANRVFEDRLGLIVINPANLASRLSGIAALGIRDVFLPRTAQPADFEAVREFGRLVGGLYAHLWVAVDGLSATDYANRTLLDIQRLRPGAVELNIELGSDPPLAGYIEQAVALIRSKRPNLRLRINVAPWKGFALPNVWLASDPNLYAAMQNYEGNMDNLLSAADVLSDMARVELAFATVKLSVCYAAACRVLGSPERLRTLPDLSRLKRGVIFSDDLLAEAGLL